jgi:hypothetical protein
MGMVYDLIRKYDLDDKCCVSSFDYDILQEL